VPSGSALERGTVLEEEGRPPESIFDFVQGITAVARSRPHQDARLEMEGKAAGLLASVCVDQTGSGSGGVAPHAG
jgi:hypothetical protein